MPAVVTGSSATGNCAADAPSPQGPEETALVANGHRFLTGRHARAGAHGEYYVVEAALGYDGQCRPDPYQIYVFRNGVQAGTLSAQAMHARSDGNITDFKPTPDGQGLQVEIEHRTPSDPACCASSHETKIIPLSQFAVPTAEQPPAPEQTLPAPQPQHASVSPSFSCSRASTPTEKAICGSSELATLDHQLGRTFNEVIERAPTDRLKAVRAEQIAWIKSRNDACGGDATCIGDYLHQRIAALKRIEANGFPEPPPPAQPAPPPQPAASSVPTVAVDSITFGHSADAGGEIRQPDTQFGGKDNIFVRIQANVLTSTPQTLDVVWASVNDRVLKRDRATFTSGSHHVLFNYSDYQGLPAGQYKVGVYVDGKLVSDNSFNIAPSDFEKFKRGMEKLGVKVEVRQH